MPQHALATLAALAHSDSNLLHTGQVTVKLVEKYIKPEEMVILCLIPAMSDFGNAEVSGFWFSSIRA